MEIESLDDLCGVIWQGAINVSDEIYHRESPGVSSTTLKRYLRSPAHAKMEQEDTKALAFGRALHLAVLQPDKFQELCQLAPTVDRRTKAGKEEYENWSKGITDKHIIVTSDELDAISSICHALDRKSRFDDLMAGASFEVAHFGVLHHEDGELSQDVLCKCKPDIFHPGGVVADLKSTEDASPRAFLRECLRYHYHVSAAFYLDVLAAAGCPAPESFVWIAVEKKPPYGVAFYSAPDEMIEDGRRLYRQALGLHVACERTGVWPDYPDEILDLNYRPMEDFK